jgi:hypothetical protein
MPPVAQIAGSRRPVVSNRTTPDSSMQYAVVPVLVLCGRAVTVKPVLPRAAAGRTSRADSHAITDFVVELVAALQGRLRCTRQNLVDEFPVVTRIP